VNRAGRTLIFESLIQRKNGATGEVALSIRPADFDPPRTVAPRAASSPVTDRLLVPLPEIRFDVPELITDSAAAGDTTRKRALPARTRDPLGPIFQNR
jgi:hypothetical protein